MSHPLQVDPPVCAALTPIQSALLTYLQSYLASYGRAPTHEEIRVALGWKTAQSAKRHLEALEKKGCLIRSPHHHRAIQLRPTAATHPPKQLPVIHYRAPGSGLLDPENIEARIAPLDPLLFGPVDFLIRPETIQYQKADQRPVVDLLATTQFLCIHRTRCITQGHWMLLRLHHTLYIRRQVDRHHLNLSEHAVLEGRVVGGIRQI